MTEPGSPSIQNVIAMTNLNTPSTAAFVPSLIVSVIEFIMIFVWLEMRSRTFTRKGFFFDDKRLKYQLSEEEMKTFQPQLEDIVGYVEKISEVDVEGVPPMMHGREIVNAFREDEVRPSLETEVALANAPARVGDEFLLPKIVEGAES